MNFNQEYENWESKVFKDVELSELQKTEMKKAFFAGGYVAINKIVEATDNQSEDVAVTKIDNIHNEITTTMKQWMK